MHEKAPEQRCRGCAVDVIIAEDRDLFPAHDRIGKSGSGHLHVAKDMRIRHQRSHCRIEKACDLVLLHSPAGKDPRQQLGHALALRHGKRAHRAAFVEPVAPGAAAHGMLNTEKQPPGSGARRQVSRAMMRPNCC